MALIETSPITPVVRPPSTERQAPAPTPSPAAPSGAPAAAAAASAPAPAASAVGFTLTFDPDTQRMILEARDAATGFVIDQMPPRYVVKQFSAQSGVKAAASRGTSIDDAS
jgi:hypothetical protein